MNFKYRVVEGSGTDDERIVFEAFIFALCGRYIREAYEDEEEVEELNVKIERYGHDGWTTDF